MHSLRAWSFTASLCVSASLASLLAGACSPVSRIYEGSGGSGGDGGAGPASAGSSTGAATSLCGNGKVDNTKGETCDPPESCPSCADADACTADVMKGSPETCDVSCSFEPITTCIAASDGCCLPGCDGSNDADRWAPPLQFNRRAPSTPSPGEPSHRIELLGRTSEPAGPLLSFLRGSARAEVGATNVLISRCAEWASVVRAVHESWQARHLERQARHRHRLQRSDALVLRRNHHRAGFHHG